MSIYNVHDAKTHFSESLERVLSGEEVIIAKVGKPLARILPFTSDTSPRQPGKDAGKVILQPDFDELLTEFEE